MLVDIVQFDQTRQPVWFLARFGPVLCFCVFVFFVFVFFVCVFFVFALFFVLLFSVSRARFCVGRAFFCVDAAKRLFESSPF